MRARGTTSATEFGGGTPRVGFKCVIENACSFKSVLHKFVLTILSLQDVLSSHHREGFPKWVQTILGHVFIHVCGLFFRLVPEVFLEAGGPSKGAHARFRECFGIVFDIFSVMCREVSWYFSSTPA